MGNVARQHENREFQNASEPETAESKGTLRFCVQRHHARRRHYDFRLEANGVLLSWAVPQGPSFDPSEKRLAVHVEDHAIDHLEFEGVIPKGEYGAGTVILWDIGVYQNITVEGHKPVEMSTAVQNGHIKFVLLGSKLRGAFALIRMRNTEPQNWLMVKVSDEYADPTYDPVRNQPESVKSGLTNEQLGS